MLQNNFYTVSNIQHNDNNILAEIHLNDKHPIFEGHFPQVPILPGACMLQIIKELLSSSLNKKLQLTKMNEVKFLRVVSPKEHQRLTVKVTYILNASDSLNITASIVHNEITFCKCKGEWVIIDDK